MSVLLIPFKWFYHEFGLGSVYHTGRDAWLIIFTRSCRMFAYGATSLIIAVFFAALEFTDFQIGLFMSLTLAGDVALSLFITLVADRLGRRRVLLAGASLMICSGLVFAISENYVVLLCAAVVGVISPGGGDFGPFRAIEESTLSQITTLSTRSDVLSWYVTISSLGSAFGTEFAGRAVDFLRDRPGWDITSAYHAMFWLYIIMGVAAMISTASLSSKCELTQTPAKAEAAEALLDEEEQVFSISDDEDSSSQDEHNHVQRPTPIPKPINTSPRPSRFAQISRETRTVMWKLWFLLSVDSLADGMVSLSLTYYYMNEKLQLPKSTLGDISSISYFLSSASTVFASPLARRLGLVNTMVFTHLPSSLAVLFFPVPQGVFFTVLLFYIRTGLNNMDQAPRAALIAAVVKPEERTAAMGITSMLRTLAQTIGPSITGLLAGSDHFWVSFVVAGLLRIAYDLGLFALFVRMKIEESETEDRSSSRAAGSSRVEEPGRPESIELESK